MNKNVVVVDDDPMIRFLVAEFLKAHGFLVTALESGSACLEHLGHTTADLVIVDLQMPEMSGLEVLKNIRHNLGLGQLPVIMLTANIQDGKVDPELRATSYVEKPFDMNSFLADVQRLTE